MVFLGPFVRLMVIFGRWDTGRDLVVGILIQSLVCSLLGKSARVGPPPPSNQISDIKSFDACHTFNPVNCDRFAGSDDVVSSWCL